MMAYRDATHKAADMESKGSIKTANGATQKEFRDKREPKDATKTFCHLL